MLSTIDNPFNPLVDFDSWLRFDIEFDHRTCETLARNVKLTPEMSQSEEEEEIERAIDDIIKYDPEHKFIKVTSLVTVQHTRNR